MTHRRWYRPVGSAAIACAALVLNGCGTTAPSHFYTLSADPAALPPASTQSGQLAAAPILFEMGPASVPQQVARPQMVITVGPGQVALREQERWIAPLADEIRTALAASLSASLHGIDVSRIQQPEGRPVYRIIFNVQRFESVLDNHATIDAVWSVRRSPDQTMLTCHSVVTANVGPGYEALAAGHRQALQRISDDIAATIRNMAGMSAGAGAPACPLQDAA